MTIKCETCGFFEPMPSPVGVKATGGHCYWEPPPFVGRMIAIAQAEAALRINWAAEADKPPVVLAGHKCSAWQAKGSPVTRADRIIAPGPLSEKAVQ